ncbi:MAG: site-2 protease family protein [Deltaproteobacteria bacterium]|nr:site-2 protease family protein [Deltaproteobacteria bacterium]
MRGIVAFLVAAALQAMPVIAAIVLHELSHGYVARALGDDTAARAGRLTLNPLAHIDLFGTVILPGLLLYLGLPVFGYAKPVPVDFRRLRNPRRDMVKVAAAGPLTNFVLAAASGAALRMAMAAAGPDPGGLILLCAYILEASVTVNVVLAVFNLFPLPPLDGGRVVAGLLPATLARPFVRIERYGFLVLLLLLYAGVIDRVTGPLIDALRWALL